MSQRKKRKSVRYYEVEPGTFEKQGILSDKIANREIALLTKELGKPKIVTKIIALKAL